MASEGESEEAKNVRSLRRFHEDSNPTTLMPYSSRTITWSKIVNSNGQRVTCEGDNGKSGKDRGYGRVVISLQRWQGYKPTWWQPPPPRPPMYPMIRPPDIGGRGGRGGYGRRRKLLYDPYLEEERLRDRQDAIDDFSHPPRGDPS